MIVYHGYGININSLKKSNSMEGLYITEDFQLHKIEKLQPKEFPDYLTKT